MALDSTNLPDDEVIVARVVTSLALHAAETHEGRVKDELEAIASALTRGKLAIMHTSDVQDVITAALYGEGTHQAELSADRLGRSISAAHRVTIGGDDE